MSESEAKSLNPLPDSQSPDTFIDSVVQSVQQDLLKSLLSGLSQTESYEYDEEGRLQGIAKLRDLTGALKDLNAMSPARQAELAYARKSGELAALRDHERRKKRKPLFDFGFNFSLDD